LRRAHDGVLFKSLRGEKFAMHDLDVKWQKKWSEEGVFALEEPVN
jgi:hypothetical protein